MSMGSIDVDRSIDGIDSASRARRGSSSSRRRRLSTTIDDDDDDDDDDDVDVDVDARGWVGRERRWGGGVDGDV